MKFESLNLIAFGPFTRTVLNFLPREKGLHLVYGPNEAGKSSALRALRFVLYGIPERCSDDFLHPYARMRIGATLSGQNGKRIEFVRRKGRSGTLRDAGDMDTLNESVLSEFLPGVDEILFSTLFGIDHAALVKGGEEIITGGGNIGQVLFSAGSGISDFRKIQADIQTEAEKLFKPGGKTPPINESIAAFKSTRKMLRDSQLSSSQWAEHDQNLQNSLSEKAAIESELDGLMQSKNRLERIQHALPSISQRKDCVEELLLYQTAVLLPETFSKRRQDAVTRLHVAESEIRQTEASLSEITNAILEIRIPENLLIHAPRIEVFHKKLGEFLKDSLDRPRLTGFHSSHIAEAMAILSGIRPEATLADAEDLKLKKTDMLTIQELGATHENLVGQRKILNTEILRHTVKLEQIRKALEDAPPVPDILDLRTLVESVLASGDMETQIDTLVHDIQKTESRISTSLSRLKPVGDDPGSMIKAPVPLPETIDRFDEDIQTHITQLKQRVMQQQECNQILADLQKHLDRIRLEQEPPTEADLITFRSERNRVWSTIRKMAWPPDNTILEDYENRVRDADTISDRLRHEADRVAQKAALLSDQQLQKHRMEGLSQEIDQLRDSLKHLQEAWETAWKPVGVIPLLPKEMRSWFQRFTELSNQMETLQDLKSRRDVLVNRLAGFSNDLAAALAHHGHAPLPGSSLAKLLETARQLVKTAELLQTRRQTLQNEIRTREAELHDAQLRLADMDNQLCDWQNRWSLAISRIGLDVHASPSQALGVLDDLKSLFGKLKEAEGFRKRIDGIDRDTQEYTDMVTSFVTRESPDLCDLSLEGMVTALNTRLNYAREAKVRQQSLIKQQRQEETSLKRITHTRMQILTEIQTLCEEACCTTLQELPDAEKRSERRHQLESERNRLDSEISRFSAGQGIETFIRDALSIDSDTIAFQLQQLTGRIDGLSSRKSQVDQVIGQEQNELRRMNGNSVSATLAEDAEGHLARIQSLAIRFIRLKLAAGVLAEAVERYREKHQGPVLKRSGELFSRMTLGAFGGLRLEYSEKGDGFLVGVRPEGEVVTVSGMSEGSADQLYLAVRIAGLEAYLTSSEPIPFIIDDILIKFDDARAIATLQILAELSEKTQIIFFTHHRHLIDLAEQHVDSRYWTHHRLSSIGERVRPLP